MSNYRWGIVSTGRMSEWFCGDFHAVPNAELAAVCSRSLASAEKFAAEFDIADAYESYEEMLSDDTLDVIYIGTPHTLHAQNAIDAMRAGKAVLCEKPITASVEECEALINCAEKTGAYLMEAMWTYFLPSMRKAKEWCDQGRIGDILHIKTDFGYPVPYSPTLREYDPALGGGCMLEMGVYPLAIASLFADGEPEVISAIGQHAPNGVEDDVTALIKIGNVTASVGASYRARLRNAAHIIGTEGYIVIPDAFRSHECSLYKIDERVDHFTAERETRGYEYQAIALCNDLATGAKSSPMMPLSRSLAFQKTIETIKQKVSETS